MNLKETGKGPIGEFEGKAGEGDMWQLYSDLHSTSDLHRQATVHADTKITNKTLYRCSKQKYCITLPFFPKRPIVELPDYFFRLQFFFPLKTGLDVVEHTFNPSTPGRGAGGFPRLGS